MNWHTIVSPVISRAVGQCGLTRAGVVRVFAHLHNDLPTRADRLRRQRDAGDPDFFLYRLTLFDGGRLHLCVFSVDDLTAAGFLFVEKMTHF